jgi:hypothetical protein
MLIEEQSRGQLERKRTGGTNWSFRLSWTNGSIGTVRRTSWTDGTERTSRLQWADRSDRPYRCDRPDGTRWSDGTHRTNWKYRTEGRYWSVGERGADY